MAYGTTEQVVAYQDARTRVQNALAIVAPVRPNQIIGPAALEEFGFILSRAGDAYQRAYEGSPFKDLLPSSMPWPYGDDRTDEPSLLDVEPQYLYLDDEFRVASNAALVEKFFEGDKAAFYANGPLGEAEQYAYADRVRLPIYGTRTNMSALFDATERYDGPRIQQVRAFVVYETKRPFFDLSKELNWAGLKVPDPVAGLQETSWDMP